MASRQATLYSNSFNHLKFGLKMNRTPVSSSNICSIGYDIESNTLEVEFNDGSIYQYFRVPQEEYANLMKADSISKYFNVGIRNKYTTKKV
jgi:hypothetical protein